MPGYQFSAYKILWVLIVVFGLRFPLLVFAKEVAIPPQPVLDSRPDASLSTIDVRAFDIAGNTTISETELQAAAQPYVNKDLTLEEIHQVADRLSDVYRKKGYTLAKAYVVAQTPIDGTIRIAVLEGRLSEIVVTGNRHYSTDFIRRGFGPVLHDGALNHRSLERSLLTLNDNLDLKVAVALAPGDATGTTKILAKAEDKLPIHVGLDANNFGFVNISRYRFGGIVDIGNVLVDGSVLTANGIIGNHPDQLSYVSGAYSVPVNGWGTRLIVSGSYSQFEVGGALAVLGINAEVKVYDVSLTHPVIKSTVQNLLVEAGFASKDNPLFVQGEKTFDDHLRMIKLGLNYDRTDHYGRSFTSLYGYQGLGEILGGMENNDPLASHVGADNRFQKATLSLGRIHRLGHDYFLLLRGTGQVSAGPLPIIEQVLLEVRTRYEATKWVSDLWTKPTSSAPNYACRQDLSQFKCSGSWITEPVAFGLLKPANTRGASLTAAGVGTRVSIPKWYHAALRLDLGFPIDPDKAQGGSLFGGSSPTVYFQVTTRY